jgi:hypothetical protein
VINYGSPARRIDASRYMQRADAAIAPRLAPMLDRAIERLIAQKGLR